MERAQERNDAALDMLENRVPFARVVNALDRGPVDMLGEIKTGGEMIAMTEDDPDLRLVARAENRSAQLLDHRIAQGVALGGPLQADQRGRPLKLVGDGRCVHKL